LSMSSSNLSVTLVQQILKNYFATGYDNVLEIPHRLYAPSEEPIWRTSHLNLGVDVHDDLFSLIYRFAFPLDDRAWKFLTLSPLPFYAFRLTPKPSWYTQHKDILTKDNATTLFGPPNVTLLRTTQTEFFLADGMEYLVQNARAKLEKDGYGCYESVTTFTRSEAFVPEWGGQCYMGYLGGFPYWPKFSAMNCQVDTRDTTYLMPLPASFLLPDEDVLLIIGVNHEATKLTTYSNVNIYNFKTKTSVVQMDDALFRGSALSYLQGSNYQNLSDFYYAVKFFLSKSNASCENDKYCMIIPETEEHWLNATPPYVAIAVERGYLNEETNMSPDDRDLIPPRFLHCRYNVTEKQLWNEVSKKIMNPPFLFYFKRFTKRFFGMQFISTYGWFKSYLLVLTLFGFIFIISLWLLCRICCKRSNKKAKKE